MTIHKGAALKGYRANFCLFAFTPRHAIATVEEADQLGIPISEEETLFSTPADTEALQTLFTSHPYPKTNVYIRRGHGFFLLHQKVSGACAQLRALVVSSDASRKQAPRG
jgi:hypothetical protein